MANANAEAKAKERGNPKVPGLKVPGQVPGLILYFLEHI